MSSEINISMLHYISYIPSWFALKRPSLNVLMHHDYPNQPAELNKKQLRRVQTFHYIQYFTRRFTKHYPMIQDMLLIMHISAVISDYKPYNFLANIQVS